MEEGSNSKLVEDFLAACEEASAEFKKAEKSFKKKIEKIAEKHGVPYQTTTTHSYPETITIYSPKSFVKKFSDIEDDLLGLDIDFHYYALDGSGRWISSVLC